MDLQRQEQRQNREPQKMTPELYQEILSTVAREHLRNINSELHQLQSEILERVKLSELGKKELNNFVLFAPNVPFGMFGRLRPLKERAKQFCIICL